MSKEAVPVHLFRLLFKLMNAKFDLDATYAHSFIEHEMEP